MTHFVQGFLLPRSWRKRKQSDLSDWRDSQATGIQTTLRTNGATPFKNRYSNQHGVYCIRFSNVQILRHMHQYMPIVCINDDTIYSLYSRLMSTGQLFVQMPSTTWTWVTWCLTALWQREYAIQIGDHLHVLQYLNSYYSCTSCVFFPQREQQAVYGDAKECSSSPGCADRQTLRWSMEKLVPRVIVVILLVTVSAIHFI